MICKWCEKDHNNKTFCSGRCKQAWFLDNNYTNNPMHEKVAKEKMRNALKGRKQPREVTVKRGLSLKKHYAADPARKMQRVRVLHQKYTSKIRGTGWRLKRIKALERDGYMCQICHRKGGSDLVVHHLDWRGKRRYVSSTKMNNDLSNLQTLCHKCHNGIHRHRSSDYHKRYHHKVIAP